MTRRLTMRKKMQIKRSAQKQKDKWEARLIRTLDNFPEGLTLAQLKTKKAIHNCPFSDQWITGRLDYLQSLCLVWYNPQTDVWKAIPPSELLKTTRQRE